MSNARATGVFLAAALLGAPAPALWAQGGPPAASAPEATPPRGFVRAIARDQPALFTSPARVRARDLKWLVPLAGSAAWLLTTDDRNMRERIKTNLPARERSLTISNFSVGALAAAPVFLYWSGRREADDYRTQTAVLSARAIADTLIATEVLRGLTRREQPGASGSGAFFASGKISSSFPSLHSGAAWAIASVLAERYPGWLTQVGAYGLAGAVSISRVTAREHQPSDVLVGSALGLAIGRYLTRIAGRAGAAEGSAVSGSAAAVAERHPAAATGSTYVPLESWIYVALDRLAALGLIPSQTSGLRPWTRAECRRQAEEAESRLTPGLAFAAEASEILAQLHRELEEPARGSGVVLESLYIRNGVIAGPVLNDSFHFGQTWINDSGRPFGRGWNSYEGFTARAESGRFFAYVQGEYQHAPGAGAYPLPVRETISRLDGVPLQPADPDASTNRFRTLDVYAGVRLGDLQFSAGKQSMWWGPTYDAPLSFSNNAEPTKNFKAALDHPILLPGVFRHLGEIRGEFVIGKLGGQKYTWRPWFNAQKVSFKLTENLEMGFTRWSIFWGVGHPITVGSLSRNFTSTSSPLVNGVGRSDPGDRKGGFDFRYRLPGIRNWVTLYSDSYCDDDPSPLAAPRRAAINPGIRFTRVPGVARLDLRVEAPSTTPLGWDMGGQYNYFNSQYRSGNTNYGELLGNPVGRDGRAVQATSTYYFSPRTTVEATYRQSKLSGRFLPGGGTQNDAILKSSAQVAEHWRLDGTIQYERFWIPQLGGPARNRSAVVQLTWEPAIQLMKRDR